MRTYKLRNALQPSEYSITITAGRRHDNSVSNSSVGIAPTKKAEGSSANRIRLRSTPRLFNSDGVCSSVYTGLPRRHSFLVKRRVDRSKIGWLFPAS